MLIDEFDPVQEMLSYFVEIEQTGNGKGKSGDTVLKVDADGQGTEYDMTAVAIIQNGGKDLDVQALYDSGQIVI